MAPPSALVAVRGKAPLSLIEGTPAASCSIRVKDERSSRPKAGILDAVEPTSHADSVISLARNVLTYIPHIPNLISEQLRGPSRAGEIDGRRGLNETEDLTLEVGEFGIEDSDLNAGVEECRSGWQ